MSRAISNYENIPAKLEFTDSKHMNDWNRAKAFVEKYGEEFISDANEICRNIGIETMRMYQLELSQKLLPDSGVQHSSKEELTFPKLKVIQFQKLLSGLIQLCAVNQRDPLVPETSSKKATWVQIQLKTRWRSFGTIFGADFLKNGALRILGGIIFISPILSCLSLSGSVHRRHGNAGVPA